MENGLIYEICEGIFSFLRLLNPFEWSKKLAEWICKLKKISDTKRVIYYKRLAGDIYVLLKWQFILFLWMFHIHGRFWTFVVWYLIFMNVFSFFYTLIWKESKGVIGKVQMRRRFLNFLQAIFYSHFGFAYLYKNAYAADFQWNDGATSLHAVWFSVSNSVAGNYDQVKAITEAGYGVSMIQFIVSFIFLTIIIGKAIPSE